MSEHAWVAWDKAAATFDEAADHGLRDVEVHAAWVALMARVLPVPPSRIADLGCGTGTLTILAADLGHRVDGIDFSAQMLSVARAKAGTRTDVDFSTGDAARPQLPVGEYHAVMSRHVLWALPDPAEALQAWSRLLRPGGRLVLIEGRWSTGAGITSTAIGRLLRGQGYATTIEQLSESRYWGNKVTDERYVAVARRVSDVTPSTQVESFR